ncbi:hypothetical protein ABVC46_02050 [Lactobacillus crispatus]|uniref:hypothetical protein n=2 Tax=Lactobacillus crispatus TaxID=47770 RepID=UPI00336A6DA3
MKPLNKSNNVNENHGVSAPIVNKPGQANKPNFKSKQAKRQVFGSPRGPKKKRKEGGMPLPLKIGGGVAAGAIAVGVIGYAVTNNNHANQSASNKNNSNDSDLTNNGSDNSSDRSKTKKSNGKRKKGSHDNKSKKSKKDGKETDLLNDILDGEGSSSAKKHSSSKDSSDELGSLIKSMGSKGDNSHNSGSTLKQLAKKAAKSQTAAEDLGTRKSKNGSEKGKAQNTIGSDKGKNSSSELRQLANKNKAAESESARTRIPGQSSAKSADENKISNPERGKGQLETNLDHDHRTGRVNQSTTVANHGKGGTSSKGQSTTIINHGHHSGGTTQPTSQPTTAPEHGRHSSGTTQPTSQPTTAPDHGHHSGGTTQPTSQPTTAPDHGHHSGGTTQPTSQPTTAPDHGHHSGGTTQPTSQPTTVPEHGHHSGSTTQPTSQPTTAPDHGHHSGGTTQPTSQPTTAPNHGHHSGGTTQPTSQPTTAPDHEDQGGSTTQPTSQPTTAPDHEDQGGSTTQPTSQPTTTPISKLPYENVPDGSTKAITFIDDKGNNVGTGELTKNGNSVNVKNIPYGYKLSDEDSEGHSAQLLQWPDQISVVSDGSQPDQPATPKYPSESVADGTSKPVTFIDDKGNNVGTGIISKNGNSVNVKNIPYGYKLSDEDSEGHSAQLLQWPDQISVVSDGSQPDQPATPKYPSESVADGTSKPVTFIDDKGNNVGTGIISKNGNSVNVKNIPYGYKLSDEDSEGHSTQLLQWPDQISVVSDGSQPATPSYPIDNITDGSSKSVSFIDNNGNVVGTGIISKDDNSVKVKNIPYGYKLSDEDSEGHSAQLLQWPDQITVKPVNA